MKLYSTKDTNGTWFAWKPVETISGDVVWLERVHRSFKLTIGGWTSWTYQRITK